MAGVANEQVKVYADSSVFGGVFDIEFCEPSIRFFDEIDAGRFSLVISSVVVGELVSAPEQVWTFLGKYAEKSQIVEVSEQAEALQSNYLELEVVTERARVDALHVAIATVTGCNIVVSWNFKDIVHVDKIRKYNQVNTLFGYCQIDISSPEEVTARGRP